MHREKNSESFRSISWKILRILRSFGFGEIKRKCSDYSQRTTAMDFDAIGCDGLVHTECEPPSSLLMGSNTSLGGTFPTAVEILLEDLQTYHSRMKNQYMCSYCSLKEHQYPNGACESARYDDIECPEFLNVGIEPLRLLRQPLPAPPPRLHYSTWWRSLCRKLMDRQYKL